MAGIYIHIPFCKKACSYCDFHFSTSFSKYRNEMIAAICKEIELRKSYLKTQNLSTIYFGGGTPSLLTQAEIKDILVQIKLHFTLSKNAEVTLEANPDDINEERLAGWKNEGINRLSIGVQSFRDKDLKWMNRAHNLKDAHNALRLSKKIGFELSLDLIYGLPNFSLQEWEENIETALMYKPEHFSAYCLTVEQNTALYKAVQSNKIQPSSNEEQAKQFEVLIKTLKKHGYEHYEISNFARDEKYAKHNSNYWLGKEYLGIGPSAHSYNQKGRAWNISNNPTYIKNIVHNKSVTEEEVLSLADKFNEALLIGLRTKWGVNLEQLPKELVDDKQFQKTVQKLIFEKKATVKENHLILTAKGKPFADALASELFIIE